MAKRYTQLKLKQELKQLKKEKELKEMTLQAAWDIVSDYLASRTTNGGTHCFFVDSCTGDIVKDWKYMNVHNADNVILLKSTKKYR